MTWTKGQSGNPAGRAKKGKSLTDELRALLNQKGPDGVKHRDAIAQALVGQARAGDIRSIAYIYDRLDGKPINHLEASGPDGSSLMFTIDIDRVAPADYLALPPGETDEDGDEYADEIG